MKQHQRQSDERGIALIMTLGVLSILTVTALTFAVTSLQSQTMAKLSEQTVQARLAVETAFQQIYLDMNTALADPNNRRNLYPGAKLGVQGQFGPTTQSSAWDGRVYNASLGSDTSGIREALHVSLGGVDYTPDPSNAMLHSSVGWIHQTDPDTGGITGRYCYVVVHECGKLDPTTAIHDTNPEGTETATAVGNSPSDVNLLAAMQSGLANRFQYVGVGVGQLPVGRRWLSHYNIFKQNTNAVGQTSQVLQRVFPHSYDIEAFNNGVTDKHRFFISDTDWDTFDNTLSNTGLNADASDFLKNGEFNANTGGIPWFFYCTDETLKNQVMANLLDYCDSDSVATTDDADNPTYVGNEKVPYINEILFAARMYQDGLGINYLELQVWPELINMWDVDLGEGADLTITLSLASPELLLSPTVLTYTWEDISDVATQSYDTLPSSLQTVVLGAVPALSDLTVTVTSAKLTDSNDKLWDFAKTEVGPGTFLDASQMRYVYVECDDPRHNLDATNWFWASGDATWSNLTFGTTSPAATNTVCNPNPGVENADRETDAVDPWDVSTAYIRNGPIVSLWELGAIHRGGAWQTINLTRYRELVADTTGMGDYALGDANILDQVKTTNENIGLGKVNINSGSVHTFRGLMTGLSVGDTYETPTGSGATITNDNVSEFCGTFGSLSPGNIFYENGTAVVIAPFPNRGAFARCSITRDGSVIDPQAHNRAEEEIIGKIANIATVRSNYFVAVVVAQTIRDLPTGIFGGTLGSFDVGVDLIQAEQKLLVHIYRDALTNDFEVIRYEYLEE